MKDSTQDGFTGLTTRLSSIYLVLDFLKGSMQILVVIVIKTTMTPKKIMWNIFSTSEIGFQNPV